MSNPGGMGTTGQNWPIWAKAVVWVLLLAPLVLVVVLIFGGQTLGPIAIENDSASPVVVKAYGIRDNTGSTELFAVPPHSRVIVGRDGLFPRELTLMSADCAQTIATYTLDTGHEGGAVKVDASGYVRREPGDPPRFGDNAAPATCPTS